MNIPHMLVTDDTSHADRSWLKDCALLNIPAMLVTAETSHAERSWLKEWASKNIPYIKVTADTFHADKSWLKDCARKNMLFVSLTADTSHDPIGRCGPAEQLPTGDSLRHASTEFLSSALFRGANTVVTPTRKAFAVRVLRGCWSAHGRGLGVYCISRLVSVRH